MRKKTFPGGVHPLSHIHHGKRLTDQCAVEVMPVPDEVIIPMSRIIGAPAKPLVKKGDQVLMGQLIGEAQGFISAHVHASVSGKVKAVKDCPHPTGEKRLAVVIENDHKDEVHPDIKPYGTIESMESKAIVDMIKACGIVGMGGATFPAHVKLMPPPDKKIDVVILNGAECEPYLTSDHRLMVEHPERVVNGLRAVLKVMDGAKGYIGIEDNKKNAIEKIKAEIRDDDNIEVGVVKVKYPQGAEKQLIHAITKRVVPSGKLPMDVGVVVMNVGTAAEVYNAMSTGMPSVQRIVTVTGHCIKEPKNLMVRFGTTYGQCIDYCGGFTEEPGKVISGGPMMGIAQPDLLAPVIAGTSGILALTAKETLQSDINNCIRCGRCVQACPMNLMPYKIAASADGGRFDEAQKFNAMDCVECGSCSYICPSRRMLVQSIRLSKNAIRKSMKK